MLPELLKVCLSLLRGVIELQVMSASRTIDNNRRWTYGIALEQVVIETGEAQLAQIVNLWVQRLESVLLFLGEIAFAHGQGKIGCTLVNIKVARGWSHFLYWSDTIMVRVCCKLQDLPGSSERLMLRYQ